MGVVITAERPSPRRSPTRSLHIADAALLGLLVVGVGLRFWDLGGARLSFDESFTATVGRLPLGAMVSFLRHNDSHPPLDYLVRAPLARAGLSEFWLRAPSVVESVAALAFAAWWWRALGRLGLMATALLATSAFAITYAHDARMYAGLGLAGVVVAWAACRWLERPSPATLGAMGAGLLAALFLQGGALLVLPGVFVVPGFRRDRAAWAWRATVCGAAAAWAVVWGPAFLDQLRRPSDSWVPLTTTHAALISINELVDQTPVVAVLVVGLIVAGAFCVPRGPMRRVVGSVGWAVIATYVLVGLRFHVLLPRAMAFAAWAPLFALASLCDAALRRSRAIGEVMIALIALIVVPSAIVDALPTPAPQAAAFAAVQASARPGDEVVMNPAFLWTLPAWYFSARWRPHGSLVYRTDLAASGTVIGGGTPSGPRVARRLRGISSGDGRLGPMRATATSRSVRRLLPDRHRRRPLSQPCRPRAAGSFRDPSPGRAGPGEAGGRSQAVPTAVRRPLQSRCGSGHRSLVRDEVQQAQPEPGEDQPLRERVREVVEHGERDIR